MLQCGLVSIPLGITYMADRLGDDGSEITSSIDHIYLSQDIVPSTRCSKLESSATDHLPIMACTNLYVKTKPVKQAQKTITKRSMKNFTKTRWFDCLRNRDWSKISYINDVEKKAEEFTNQVNIALDECVPLKQFKIKESFKPGLTEEAKKIMLERDQTRQKIAGSSKEDKMKLKAKYKQLRNRAIAQIRRDAIRRNGDKIAETKNERETWKVINEIIKP